MGPEDIFAYGYGIMYSPTYRNLYQELLRREFPRIPLTEYQKLFRSVVEYGNKLIGMHLMQSKALENPITQFTQPGQNDVTKGFPKYQDGRVYINVQQYFDRMSEDVWNFHIGSYQVCEKWLKDRRGRELSYDDLTHYQKVVVALKDTIRLMEEIDAAIPRWPIR